MASMSDRMICLHEHHLMSRAGVCAHIIFEKNKAGSALTRLDFALLCLTLHNLVVSVCISALYSDSLFDSINILSRRIVELDDVDFAFARAILQLDALGKRLRNRRSA